MASSHRRTLGLFIYTLALMSLRPSFSLAQETTPTTPRDAGAISPLLQGWTISPGVGVRVIDLRVTRKSDGWSGTITNDGSFTDPIFFSLDIESPAFLLDDKWGLSLRSHTETFRISRQRVPSSTSSTGEEMPDVGTSVSGTYSYVGPAAFYRIVEPRLETRVGVGLGFWSAQVSGDIILAPGGAAQPGMLKTSISGVLKNAIGPIVYYQARGERFYVEASVSQVDMSSAAYETTLHELVMAVSYTIVF